MLKLLTLVTLCVAVVLLERAAAGGTDYKIEKNPEGYGSYECPEGYKPYNLDFRNRKHFTYMTFGTQDDAICALKGNKGTCKKANGKKKFWLTYYYGYGEFHISKFDRFSHMSSSSSSHPSSSSSSSSSSSGKKGKKPGRVSGSSTSTSLVEQYFAVRAIYFKVRGVAEITITLTGDISKVISINSNVLDFRKKTFICLSFESFPIFKTILFEFHFERRKKAKFWDLYIVSCCEILSDKVWLGK